MGCSYDPVPHTIYPSPVELWMEENGFSEIRLEASRGASQVLSTCHYCGQVLAGSRYGQKFLAKHILRCPERTNRHEIPEKTESECKQHPRVVYR
jgi:hypothetical protein